MKKIKTVFCMGVFDLCHLGHINFFRAAKDLGDKLIVGLIGDEAVRKMKGEDRPIVSYKDRLAYLQAIKYIDSVVALDSFNSDEPLKIFRPDIYYKGSDQTHINDSYAIAKGIPIIYHDRPDDGWSTTNLIKKIKGM